MMGRRKLDFAGGVHRYFVLKARNSSQSLSSDYVGIEGQDCFTPSLWDHEI